MTAQKTYVKNEGDEPGKGTVGAVCTTKAGREGRIVAGSNDAPICRPNDSTGPVPA